MEPQRSALVGAWIAAQDAEEGSKEWEENCWASDDLIRLAIDKPDETWDVILRIHAQELSEKVRGMLAAGPLEDLLVYHGEQYIKHVRALALKDPIFKETLAGVWLDANEISICKKFYEIAGVDMPFPEGWSENDS